MRSLDIAGTGMQAQQTNIDPRAPDFLSSHPATPERVTNAIASARQTQTPGGGVRDMKKLNPNRTFTAMK